MKLDYEDVKQAFKDGGCTLLSSTYVRNKDKLSFICECGRTAEISYNNFTAGQRCWGCRGERISKSSRHSYEFVKATFEKAGCKLLSKRYESSHKNLDYICECGNEAKITLTRLQLGQRCRDCGIKKISESQLGAKHPLYNPNKTDEERFRKREYPEYYNWRKSVFKRDKYTCQCCGEEGGELNAHHIEAYSRALELRTSVDNGITLCKRCHDDYHRDFYRNDADADSFYEFMYGEYRDPWYAGEVFDD